VADVFALAAQVVCVVRRIPDVVQRRWRSAGLSWDDIELAFFEAMKDSFGK